MCFILPCPDQNQILGVGGVRILVLGDTHLEQLSQSWTRHDPLTLLFGFPERHQQMDAIVSKGRDEGQTDVLAVGPVPLSK